MEKFTEKSTFKSEKRSYLPQCLTDKGFKGTVVNRSLIPLHGRSLEITLTFHLTPLKVFDPMIK